MTYVWWALGALAYFEATRRFMAMAESHLQRPLTVIETVLAALLWVPAFLIGIFHSFRKLPRRWRPGDPPVCDSENSSHEATRQDKDRD